MTDPTRSSRRRALVAAGTAVTAAIAGCSGGSGGNGDDDFQDLRPEDWEGVSEITLEGFTNGWRGVDPDVISGVRNPTLVLFEGESYDITWENRDGVFHNIEIVDEDDAVVDGYRTERMRERGATQTLSITATDEMHAYLCRPHPVSMLGYIRVVSE